MAKKKEEWQELGHRLREERKYRGYSQKDIAELLDTNRSSISLLENGERKIDSIELQKLAKFYNTTIDNLVVGEDTQSRREVELVARATEDLSSEDQKEVLRFVEFLRSRNPGSEQDEPSG